MSNRYGKLVHIGSGSFGEAWLVTSVCSGRRYVMKEIKVFNMSKDDVERTHREAAVLARCKHVNIVRFKESFMDEQNVVMHLVMEYADGGDLSERVKVARQVDCLIPEATILHWFIQIVFAVQYLHNNDILHRDLKTENIFLTRSNIIKVGDFGIARFLRNKQDLAMTAAGTPYYISPEICLRRPYNHKSDMWAVGCILYELCTLRHPFEAQNLDDLLHSILNGKFIPIAQSYSLLVQNLVAVLIRRSPDGRPNAEQILVVPALKFMVEFHIKNYEKISRRISDSGDSPITQKQTPASEKAQSLIVEPAFDTPPSTPSSSSNSAIFTSPVKTSPSTRYIH